MRELLDWLGMSNTLITGVSWIIVGVISTGIFRTTPPSFRDDTPNAVWVCLWPILWVWFLWWFLFEYSPEKVSVFYRSTTEKRPKKKVPSQTLPEDEVQKILIGELTKPKTKSIK